MATSKRVGHCTIVCNYPMELFVTHFTQPIKMRSIKRLNCLNRRHLKTRNLFFILNNYFLISSCPTGSSSAIATARHPRHARPVPDERRCRRDVWIQRSLLPKFLHITAVARRAVSDIALRPDLHADQQHHGHRQHLRAGGTPPLLGRRVGPQHPVLSRPASHRSGRAATPSLVRAVRPQRIPVFNAAARGATVGRRRPPCIADGRRPSRRIYGSH